MLGVAQYLGRVDDNLWFGVVKIGPALLHPLTIIYGLSGSAMISATLQDSEAMMAVNTKDTKSTKPIGVNASAAKRAWESEN